MSFYYNATWKPSVGAYTPRIGGWKPGYGLGAWSESDFTAEQIQRSKDVGAAVEMTINAMDRRYEAGRKDASKSADATKALDVALNLKAQLANYNWSPSQGLLSVDDDDSIYAIHSAINFIYDSMDGNLLAHADNAVNAATGGRIVSFGDLVDKSGDVYEDYFNAYYIDDQSAPSSASTPSQTGQTVTDASGKTKTVKSKKTPIKKGIGAGGMFAVVAVAGLLGWLGYKTLIKPKRW